MIKLYKDIINNIIQFLNQYDSLSFILVSKYIYNNNNGFIKKFKFDGHKNLLVDSIQRYLKNMYSLQYLVLENIDDPHIWFYGKLPKIVNYHRCSFYSIIDPPIAKDTEILFFYDPYYFRHQRKIQVNWNKFPNLKLVLYKDVNINFNGIQQLTCIEKIINDSIYYRNLLDNINNFKY